MTCSPLRASKLMGMSERELILQLEKASTTLTRLKQTNAALKKRIRELESRQNEITIQPPAPAPTTSPSAEVQELRDLLATAQRAAIDNLTYAQEVKAAYEELLASRGVS